MRMKKRINHKDVLMVLAVGLILLLSGLTWGGNLHRVYAAQDGMGSGTLLNANAEYLTFDKNMVQILFYNEYSVSEEAFWLGPNAVITVSAAENYHVSIDGSTWSAQVDLTNDNSFFYVKDKTTGACTDKVWLRDINVYRDNEAPTGVIRLDEHHSWETLINKITFGLFFKDAKTATIIASDSQSGLSMVRYHVATDGVLATSGKEPAELLEALNALGSNSWQEFYDGEPIPLQGYSKNVIYARLLDRVGNLSYISSDGIVLYSDSTTNVENISYTKFSNVEPIINIHLNGNTISKVKIDDMVLDLNRHYLISESGTNSSSVDIVIKPSMLDDLLPGTHSLTVEFDPLGMTFVEGTNADTPSKISVNLNIEKALLRESDFTVTPPKQSLYDGQQKEVSVTGPEMLFSDYITVKYYDENGSAPAVDDDNNAQTAPVNAGTYTVKLDVKSNDFYMNVTDLGAWKFTIHPIVVADMEMGAPAKLEAFYGQTLGEFLEEFEQPQNASGTWSWAVDPETVLDNVGEFSYLAVFTPADTSNYDWSNVSGWNGSGVQVTVPITVSAVTESWGEEIVREDGVKQYVISNPDVSDYGKTSVELSSQNLDENKVLWLKEESDGQSAWFGADLSDSSLSLTKGYRFYVQWLSTEDDKFSDINALADQAQKSRIEDDKGWFFQMGVEDQDGNKVQPTEPLDVYVQIGDDWDEDELQAYFLSSGADEALPVDHRKLVFPDGNDSFGRMTLSHFSPYLIFDEEIKENPSNDGETGKSDSEVPGTSESKSEVASPNTGDTTVRRLTLSLAALAISAMSVCLTVFARARKYRQ